MKQYLSLIYTTCILLQFCPACISEDNTPMETPTFIITGNQQKNFQLLPPEKNSRLNSSQILETGSQISFFSQGGIKANNLTLTFDGNTWNGNLDDTWIPGENTASITTYYPILSSDIYQNDGTLTDWLYQKQNISPTNQIKLNFSHLFSQISFHIPLELNNQTEELRFTPSVSVSAIEPYTANIVLGEKAPTLHFKQKPDATYTFIVPPSEAASITIEIECADGKIYATQLPETVFKRGTHYNCNILYDDGTAGIRTAEDFIAFSHLINGEAYKNRKLDEFGFPSDGKMVYRLKNDIHFTEEESSQLLPIGYSIDEDKYFKDVFEGNYHTLSGISLKKKIIGHLGIFGAIGSSGELRNLLIKDITYNISDKTSNYDGLLCGYNGGTINNCHSDSCTIETISPKQEIGALCGVNTGLIVNSSTQHLNASKATSVGGLVHSSSGTIANCYVATCTYPKPSKGKAGCISYQLYDNAILCNSYVYEKYQKNVYALAQILNTTKGTPQILYCYYPKGMTAHDQSPTIITENVKSYAESTAYKLPGVLNNWISDKGNELYPDVEFSSWQKGKDIPAVFVTSERNK